jgi:hypothetical protein
MSVKETPTEGDGAVRFTTSSTSGLVCQKVTNMYLKQKRINLSRFVSVPWLVSPTCL